MRKETGGDEHPRRKMRQTDIQEREGDRQEEMDGKR